MKTMAQLIEEFNQLLDTNFQRPIGTKQDTRGNSKVCSFGEMCSSDLSTLKNSKVMVGISYFNLIQIFEQFLKPNATKNTTFYVDHYKRNDFRISRCGQIIELKFKTKDITVRNGLYSYPTKVKQIVSIELLSTEVQDMTFLEVIDHLNNQKIEKETKELALKKNKEDKKLQDEVSFNELLKTHNMSEDDFVKMLNLYNSFKIK